MAAGAIADLALKKILGETYQLYGSVVQIGPHEIDNRDLDPKQIDQNPFSAVATETRQKIGKPIWMRFAKTALQPGRFLEIVARGIPAGLGQPIYGKLDAEIALGDDEH